MSSSLNTSPKALNLDGAVADSYGGGTVVAFREAQRERGCY